MSENPIKTAKDKEVKEIDEIILSSSPTLKSIDANKRKAIISATIGTFTMRSHSGPLPDVETLEGYNNIIPNGAERLMKQVELQSEHRRKIESAVIKSNNIQSLLGQIFGFIISVVILSICCFLAIEGHDTVASILGGTTIIGLVSVFVIGKHSQKEDFNK